MVVSDGGGWLWVVVVGGDSGSGGSVGGVIREVK